VSRRSEGQASVELLAGAVVFLLVALIGLQLLAIGYGAVMADHAAEVAALALANGHQPDEAAQDAIPGWTHEAMTVGTRGGQVRVTLRPPSPLTFLRKRLVVSGEATVRRPSGSG
jgi:hypothetical protein